MLSPNTKDYSLGNENAFGPTWAMTQSRGVPGASGTTESGNLCSGCAATSIQGTGGSRPGFSGQVSFPHNAKKAIL